MNEYNCSLASLCGGYFCAGDICTESSVWCCASPYPGNRHPYAGCYNTVFDKYSNGVKLYDVPPQIFEPLWHSALTRCMNDVDAAQRHNRTDALQRRKIEAAQLDRVHSQNEANEKLWGLVAVLSGTFAALGVLWAYRLLPPGHRKRQAQDRAAIYEPLLTA